MSSHENIITTLAGLAFGFVLLCKLSSSGIRENFGFGLQGQINVIQEQNGQALKGGYASMLRPAANVQYNPAAQMAMMAPKQSAVLSYANTREEFNNARQGCRQGNGGSGDINPVASQAQYMETSDMMPVQQMGMGLNALGEIEGQPIIYDRYIFANQKSRTYGQGDSIRGDLPIIPNNNGWFDVSAQPQIDLRDGALMSMGGLNNDTSKELQALRTASSGGTLNVGGGINYVVQKSSYLGGAGGDINITAFP